MDVSFYRARFARDFGGLPGPSAIIQDLGSMNASIDYTAAFVTAILSRARSDALGSGNESLRIFRVFPVVERESACADESGVPN